MKNIEDNDSIKQLRGKFYNNIDNVLEKIRIGEFCSKLEEKKDHTNYYEENGNIIKKTADGTRYVVNYISNKSIFEILISTEFKEVEYINYNDEIIMVPIIRESVHPSGIFDILIFGNYIPMRHIFNESDKSPQFFLYSDGWIDLKNLYKISNLEDIIYNIKLYIDDKIFPIHPCFYFQYIGEDIDLYLKEPHPDCKDFF